MEKCLPSCALQMADIHRVYLCSVVLAYVLQFQNPSLLSSPLLSLLAGSKVARYLQVEPTHLLQSESC